MRSVRVDCFAASSTNHLIWNTYSGSGWRWNGWTDLGGNPTGRPACIPVGSVAVECYYGGTDKALYRKVYDGYYWAEGNKLGGSTVVRPECVVRKRYRLLYRRRQWRALDNPRQHHRQARTWKKLGTGFGLAPQCINSGSGKLDCFAQSAKQHSSRATSTARPGAPGPTWAATSSASRPATSLRRPRTLLRLLLDGRRLQPSGEAAAGRDVASRADLGGAIQQKPSCVIMADGRKDCFGRGTDNALWQKSFY